MKKIIVLIVAIITTFYTPNLFACNKSSIDIVLELHSVSIVVTNTPYTCFGSNYSHIKDFKRYQDVTFPDSLVCIAYSEINKPEAELKPFCIDIPAFLHMFKLCIQCKIILKKSPF